MSPDADPRRPFYHRFAWAYDLLIPRAAGPTPEAVIRLFRERGIGVGSSVVDAGCGSGSYAVAMAAGGLNVIAIDRSPELLDQARTKATGVATPPTFVQGEIQRWNPERALDGVLCRGVLNDVLTDGERDGAFAAIARWLRPGGVLLADVRDWEASRARYLEQGVSETRVELEHGWLLFTSRTIVDEAAQRLEVDELFIGKIAGEPIDARYHFTMRCWSPPELRERAEMAGFARLSFLDDEGDGHRADRLVIAACR